MWLGIEITLSIYSAYANFLKGNLRRRLLKEGIIVGRKYMPSNTFYVEKIYFLKRSKPYKFNPSP